MRQLRLVRLNLTGSDGPVAFQESAVSLYVALGQVSPSLPDKARQLEWLFNHGAPGDYFVYQVDTVFYIQDGTIQLRIEYRWGDLQINIERR